jgi:Zn-dependent peptidase ImmA (M78 family)
MGGLVTKQALSKHERGLSMPSPTVANRLASALGVKALHLWSEPQVSVEFVAYRRLSRLGKKEQSRVEAIVGKKLEERCCLQKRLGLENSFGWLEHRTKISRPDEAEFVADEMRKRWTLGSDSIADLIGVLEDHLVYVLEIEAEREFDGISALAKDESGKVIACAVTTRKAVSGDRQRMNLAHELGHLVLEPKTGCDEEDAAFRFAGAFLISRDTLRREIGARRDNIQLSELMALKKRFRISLQALLRRMMDLEIISESAYKSWQILISRQGWRKVEPGSIPPEKPDCFDRMLIHGLAEGYLTTEEALSMGHTVFSSLEKSVSMSRSAFLKLPIEQRRKILESQAEMMHKYYDDSRKHLDLETGDFHEHA